jgi:hypothetical protein
MKTEVENLESFGTGESLDLATRKRELLELYSNFQDKQEKLVELFINKSLLVNVKAEILKENPEMSLDNVSTKAIDIIIEQYDNGTSNEFLDYKESFSNLLMGLAGDSKKRIQLEQELQKAGGIDKLFDTLLDTHVLRNESAKLAQYVNLLSNPRDFYEHVMKNFKFMKDLYNNREEIVKDIVNQEISAIERNTLLNTLADQGIFVDLEEFNKFIENPRYFPEYFIDVTNNRMINKGSLLYDEYTGVFRKAAQLAEKKPAGDPLSQKQILDKRLQDLENERGEKLEAERIKYETKFRDKYGMSEAEYTQQESERVASEELSDEDRKAFEKEKELITKAIDKLASDNYVDVQAAALVLAKEVLEKQGINPLEFFSEQEKIQKADKEKNKAIFNLSQQYDTSDIEDQQEAFGTRIDAALKAIIYTEYANVRLAEIETELSKKATAPVIDIKNTKEYLTYQEIVDQINDQYDELATEIKDDFKKKGIDENTADVYTVKTDFEDFDLPFQTEITDLFDTYLVDVLQEPLSIKTTNPVEYDRLRANWLERQGPLVESFNNVAKQNSLEKATRLSQPPVLKFISTKINAQTTTYVISSIIKRFQKFLENGSYPDTKGKKVQLTPEDISNIKDDIEALNGYLNARVSAAGPRNIAEETIGIIQEYVINKQDELVNVTDEDGNVIGRTFKDRGPNDPMPARSTQVAEEVETTLLNKDPFEYNAIKDTVNEDGDVVPSPVENLYNQFFNDPEVQAEDKIRLFMEAFKKKAYQAGKGGWKQFRYQEKLDAVQNSLDTVGTLDDLKRTIEKYAFKESSDAGDYVDTLIRQFLTLNASSKSNFNEFTYDDEVEIKGRMMKISDMMSRKVFDKLFAPVSITSPGGIVTKFRLGIVDGTYTILSENVKLFDRNLRDGNGVTGELDLLLVREDGSVAIVDIKTSTEYKWKEFGKGTEYDKSTYFRAQQSIYGTMFHNNTAITPDLKLMPFSVTLSEDKIGYIEDIELASIVPDGQDTIDLEYLPEIADFGIIKTTPEIKAPIKKEVAAETSKETTVEGGIKESDPIKNKIGENVNQPVIYNGRVGKLVLMPSAEFGVEIVINDDISTLQLTLDTLDANLTLEKQYGTEETISELEKNVKRISEAIKSAKGFTQVFPLQIAGKNVSNGLLKLSDAGVSLVIATDSVGQVSTINGEVINASFSNKDESIATINGVRYDVLRDATGNITVLSYFSKDKEISKIDKQIGDYAQKIGSLRSRLSTEDIESTTKDDIISRIADLQEEIKQLNNKRVSLAEANNKIYIYGENANDYIFALNRLPNGFQRATAKATKANETQDLKSIENLSLSRAIATTITEILSENYPEVLDTLIEDGVQAVKRADLKTITNWAKESITKLESLGYSVINRGDIVDDITNQINALNELLNDLTSINLTKNGRISKKQETADQLFGPGNKEVQNRSSVPKNEGTTRQSTKGVSRPATTTELQELVKQSREEGLGETFAEPVETEDVSDVIAEINNATLDTIAEVYEKAFLDAQKNGINASQIVAAYKTKLEELKTIVSIQNVSKDEYLISKNPIFTDISDEVVIVVKKKKGLITLKNIKTEESRDFTEDELIDNFEKTTMEAREPEVPVEITPVDIEDSNESKNTIKDLRDNGAEDIAKAKAQSKASDKKSRLDKLGENSKICE